jgi:sporulation protein YlmC with PRC-barrel domain
MESLKPTTFVRLRESELSLANPGDDIRGHKVINASGEELGGVKSLFVDEENRAVRLFELESGGILGFGAETRLIPVEAILAISEERVRVAPTRRHVEAAPTYDPELTERRSFEDVYSHYGYPY